jgi:hypothetical protein
MSPCLVFSTVVPNFDTRMRYEFSISDIDLFDVSQATIDLLHSKGKIVICYMWYAQLECLVRVIAMVEHLL